jgi:hypothetical protein
MHGSSEPDSVMITLAIPVIAAGSDRRGQTKFPMDQKTAAPSIISNGWRRWG